MYQDSSKARIRAVKGLGDELGMLLIAQGVETRSEATWLASMGIIRHQGYYHARPAIESLGGDLGPMLVDLRETAKT
ncbi:MAG: EAL domain-containing protein [Halomonas sp.]|uniref:EAL domain-containing protein n=1 Tax=Halomonas sp. TaxID=1486246 RepID=UPI0028700899|nr:EAL domain-containing protein [Halomonas sp.]MDR9440669.1 EAL domain-containing protein [Halomonas sp.]